MFQHADIFAEPLNPKAAPACPTEVGKNQVFASWYGSNFSSLFIYFERCTIRHLVMCLNAKKEQLWIQTVKLHVVPHLCLCSVLPVPVQSYFMSKKHVMVFLCT